VEPGLQEVDRWGGSRVTSCHIQCLAYHCEISNPLSVSTEATLFNFKVTRKEYQDIQPKAYRLQVEFVEQKLMSPGLSDENQPSYLDC